MNDTLIQTVRTMEKPLLWPEQFPCSIIYRVAVGWFVFSSYAYLWPGKASLIGLLSFLIGILLILKFGPAILRRLLPVSQALKAAWFSRRILAKKYDSYQWRKLFWIGCGMVGSVAFPCNYELGSSHYALSALCLTSGLTGLITWRFRDAALKEIQAAAAAKRSQKADSTKS